MKKLSKMKKLSDMKMKELLNIEINKFMLMERGRGKYDCEIKFVLVSLYEQDLEDVIEYCNTLTVEQMKDLLKHQMDYILLDFILWYHL